MIRRLMLIGLFAGTLSVIGTGCCLDACGVRRGPLGRPRPGGFDDCSMEDCGGCGPCGRRGGLVNYLRNRATCGAGCGEMYFDEWISDPPDCIDPCDDGGCGGCGACDDCGSCGRGRRGGRAGGFYGPRPVVNLWRGLWGRRYRPGVEYGGGYAYDDMAYEGDMVYEGEMMPQGQMMHDGEVMHGGPAPRSAPQSPTPAVPSARRLQPTNRTSMRQPSFQPDGYRNGGHGYPQGYRTASNPYPMFAR